ncbi:MAG: sigma-70 family RNA polymerase sigma factor [Planctomycetes bacterium]|nr:sigma-70 family RNA polymerase sigma factor [Planctomycetota bacterium]
MGESSSNPNLQFLLEQADWLAPLVRGLLHDHHEAEDVLQETWLQALRSPPSGGITGATRAWLSRVAIRIALRRRARAHARQWRELQVARSEIEVDSEAVADRVRLQRELADLVLGLPDAYRTAVTLRYLEGYSCEELARRLGLREEAARKRVSRGLELLRRRLDETHGGERTEWMRSIAVAAGLGSRRIPDPSSAVRTLLRSWPVGLAVLGSITAIVVVANRRPDDGIGSSEQPRKDQVADEPEHALAPGRTRSSEPALPAQRAPVPAPSDLTRLATATRSARGRVVDLRGQPVAGVSIRALRPDRSSFTLDAGASSAALLDETRTDEHGEFALATPSDAVFDLIADSAQYAQAVLPDQVPRTDWKIELHPPARLRARLVAESDGAPIAGARWRATALWFAADAMRELASGSSGPEGWIEVERLPPGWIRLEVAAEDGADASLVVELGAGAVEERLLRLAPPRIHAGVVLDGATGLPLEGAEIIVAPGQRTDTLAPYAAGRGWRARTSARTDSAGRFAVRAAHGLVPSVLFVSADGRGRRSVELSPSASADLEIVLASGRAARGRVVADARAPVAGARVVAVARERHAGSSAFDWKETTSGPDGRFELEDLRTDLDYVLRCSKPGRGARVVPIAASSTAFASELGELALPQPARVGGRVFDDHGRPAPGARVWLDWSGDDAGRASAAELLRACSWSNADGGFRFDDVPPGAFSIAAESGSRRTPASAFDVRPCGAVEAVELAFTRSDRIAGQVVDAGGRPVVNACVLLVPESGGAARPLVKVTGREGRFELETPEAGPFTLRVAPNSIHLEGGDVLVHAIELHGIETGAEALRLVLPEAALVDGRRSSRAGVPLRDRIVFARDAHRRLYTYEAADGEGRFLLRLPPGVAVDLWVRADSGTEVAGPRGVRTGTANLEFVLDEDRK